jgi:transcriptional regulator with XRE-family HTH domain
MEVRSAFGDRVRQLRLKRGLSQEAFALKAGINRTYIGDVERGERKHCAREHRQDRQRS